MTLLESIAPLKMTLFQSTNNEREDLKVCFWNGDSEEKFQSSELCQIFNHLLMPCCNFGDAKVNIYLTQVPSLVLWDGQIFDCRNLILSDGRLRRKEMMADPIPEAHIFNCLLPPGQDGSTSHFTLNQSLIIGWITPGWLQIFAVDIHRLHLF